MAQKPVLGKGLASLFPTLGQSPVAAPVEASVSTQESIDVAPKAPAPAITALATGEGAVSAGSALPARQPEISNKDRIPGIAMISIDDIQVNPYQPRRDFETKALEELADSIRANGIIQPLVVRKASAGHYELIAGERRLRASRLAGLKFVPIVVRRSTDREALELALVENIQRQNLNCVDEALAYFQLMEDFSLTQEEVASRVGKDRATVANHLRLLRLPQEILADLKSGDLTLGHGKALLSIEAPELRLRLRSQILEKHLSVRETEGLAEEMRRLAQEAATTGKSEGAASPNSKELTPVKSRLLNLSQELARAWSVKVEMKGSERRGKIVFHYSSRQELDRLLEAMQNCN